VTRRLQLTVFMLPIALAPRGRLAKDAIFNYSDALVLITLVSPRTTLL